TSQIKVMQIDVYAKECMKSISKQQAQMNNKTCLGSIETSISRWGNPFYFGILFLQSTRINKLLDFFGFYNFAYWKDSKLGFHTNSKEQPFNMILGNYTIKEDRLMTGT
ncbi:hypothetical protein ACJX0J_029236, partial [Zea mays]